MILALAGGVGGARLADGLAQILGPSELGIVVNTGDDFEHLGLHVSPDLDTVMYTLSGNANPETGWGRADETWNFMKALGALGGPDWFMLGDRDLATHIERTRRLRAGDRLSDITADLCARMGIAHTILPMSDTPVPTLVKTREGWLEFQDYFVRQRCRPTVTGFDYRDADKAQPPDRLRAWMQSREISGIVICPSNPFISIRPILAVQEIGAWLRARRVPVMALSPIIGGQAIKGPAAKMMQELGLDCSALGVARAYDGLLDGLVIDHADAGLAEPLRNMGIATLVTDALMRDRADRRRAAGEILEFLGSLSHSKR